jgi:BirA family biotin operon repressor/biotin-[acetyl-CoA-carboxylase] ligase
VKIIKLNATESTNSLLKQMNNEGSLDDFTVLQAQQQTKGRGQMGTTWQSEPSKNLTISVLKHCSNLGMDAQFFISMVTALAVSETLKKLNMPKIKIKWPNDILSDSLKISGILIENIIKNNELKSAVIGVGINVNQKFFNDLPNASSILKTTGVINDLDEVLNTFVITLQHYFKRLENNELGALKSQYEHQLFRIHKPSTFVLQNGEKLTGYINGVNRQGHLEVLTEDAIIKTYKMKEISLLY